MSKELETILEAALNIADEVLSKSTLFSESKEEGEDLSLEDLSEADKAKAAKKKSKKAKTSKVNEENGKADEEISLDAKSSDEKAEVTESADDITNESEEESIDDLVVDLDTEDESEKESEEESIDDLVAEWESTLTSESAISESDESDNSSSESDSSESDSSESDSESEVSESSKSKKKKAKILCEKCKSTEVSESGKTCENCGPKGSKKSKALNEEDEDTSDENVSESIDDLVSDMFTTEENEELSEALVLGTKQSLVAQSKDAQTCSKCNAHVKFLVTENKTYVRPLFIKKAKLPLSKRYKKMCPNCKHTEVIKKEDLGNLNKPLEENTFFIEDGSVESLEFQREFEEIETSLNESSDDLDSDIYEEKGEIDTLVEDLLEAVENGTWLKGNDIDDELDEVFEKHGTSNTGDRLSKDMVNTNKKTAITGKDHPIKGDPLQGVPSEEDGDLNNDGEIDLVVE